MTNSLAECCLLGNAHSMTRTRLNERQLDCFHATVTAGSVRKAAERLNVEPSVVSRHLQQLQAQLGLVLFERRGRGVAPTAAAQLLLSFCHDRRAREDALLAQLAAFGGTLHGRLHIVSAEGFMDNLVRWVLGEFAERHRQLQVTLEQLNAQDVVQAVATGAADCGVAYCVPSDPAAEVVQSRRLPVLAVMRPDHPCASLPEPLSLAEASCYPLAMMTTGFGLNQIVRRAALADHIQLQPVLATNSLASLRHFVLSGLGITFMSGLSIGPGLVGRRTNSRLLNTADVRVLARTDRTRTPAVNELLLFLQEKSAAWET